MGIDFIRRAAPAFEKRVSRDAATVARMGAGCSSLGHRVYVASLIPSTTRMEAGVTLLAQLRGTKILIVDRLHVVACIDEPPHDVQDRLGEIGGTTMCTVQQFNPLSETIDVVLD